MRIIIAPSSTEEALDKEGLRREKRIAGIWVEKRPGLEGEVPKVGRTSPPTPPGVRIRAGAWSQH